MNKIKFWVDVFMFFDFLILAASGFILWLVLPHNGFSFRESFILPRWEWIRIHDWTSVILIALLLIHLVLNWVWIKSMIKSVFIKKEL